MISIYTLLVTNIINRVFQFRERRKIKSILLMRYYFKRKRWISTDSFTRILLTQLGVLSVSNLNISAFAPYTNIHLLMHEYLNIIVEKTQEMSIYIELCFDSYRKSTWKWSFLICLMAERMEAEIRQKQVFFPLTNFLFIEKLNTLIFFT